MPRKLSAGSVAKTLLLEKAEKHHRDPYSLLLTQLDYTLLGRVAWRCGLIQKNSKMSWLVRTWVQIKASRFFEMRGTIHITGMRTHFAVYGLSRGE
jgi:hypothetical protein